MKTVRRIDFPFRNMPDAILPMSLAWSCTELEYERIAAGHISASMEDKWCSFVEPPWLYISRSWTGVRIYDVRLARTADGAVVQEAFVNCDPEETKGRLGTKFMEPEYLAFILSWLAGRDPDDAWENYRASGSR